MSVAVVLEVPEWMRLYNGKKGPMPLTFGQRLPVIDDPAYQGTPYMLVDNQGMLCSFRRSYFILEQDVKRETLLCKAKITGILRELGLDASEMDRIPALLSKLSYLDEEADSPLRRLALFNVKYQNLLRIQR